MPLLHPAFFRPLRADPRSASQPTDLRSLVPDRFLGDDPELVDLPDLQDLAARLAGAPELWRPLPRHDPKRRWYTRLVLSASVEVWLICWYPGQQTPIHDHGGALGALAVAEGAVEEDECGPDWTVTGTRLHTAGTRVGFSRDHVHRVANRGTRPATTIHAYSPPELPLRYAPPAAAASATASAAAATAEAATAAAAANTAVQPVTAAGPAQDRGDADTRLGSAA